MLTLFEELFLLAIDDEKGVIVASIGEGLSFGLAGAVMTELALNNRLRVKENHRLEILEPGEIEDEILNNALREIITSEKNRKISYWIDAFAGQPKKFRKQLGDRLVAKGILTQEDKRFSWVIPSPEFPGLDGPAKYGIKEHLRAITLTGIEADLHSLALLCIAKGSNLLDLIFTKDERQNARQLIYQKAIAEAMDNIVVQTIEEIEEAVSDALDGA